MSRNYNDVNKKLDNLLLFTPTLNISDIIYIYNCLQLPLDSEPGVKEIVVVFVYEWLSHLGLDRSSKKYIIKSIYPHLDKNIDKMQLIIADYRFFTFTGCTTWYDSHLEQEHIGEISLPVTYSICNIGNLYIRKTNAK